MKAIHTKMRLVVLVLGSLLLAGGVTWAAQATTWFQEFGAGSRWYVIHGSAWPVDHAVLDSMRSQLQAAAGADASKAARPVLPADLVTKAAKPEVVQVRSRMWGRRGIVDVLGTCEASVPVPGNPEAELFDVKDGGACSFSAEFDAEAKRYKWFRFNDREAREKTDIQGWHQVRGGDWWIAPGTVAKIQAQLQVAARENQSGRIGQRTALDRSTADVSSYVVQIQGRQNDGKLVVDVRGACPKGTRDMDYLDWAMMDINDGGICYFDALFDPEAGRFIRFSFHGVA